MYRLFLEYQPRTAFEPPLRPFHHVRLVCTDRGDSNKGELTADSRGWIFDAFGDFAGPKKGNNGFEARDGPFPYKGLQPGRWGEFVGVSSLPPDQIMEISRRVAREMGDYNFFLNNCKSFAKALAKEIEQLRPPEQIANAIQDISNATGTGYGQIDRY